MGNLEKGQTTDPVNGLPLPRKALEALKAGIPVGILPNIGEDVPAGRYTGAGHPHDKHEHDKSAGNRCPQRRVCNTDIDFSRKLAYWVEKCLSLILAYFRNIDSQRPIRYILKGA